MTLTPAAVRLTALGATEQFTAEVRDQNGQVMAGAGVTWASSDASVATVSGSGLVTAAGNGTATITATAGSASGTATVTVAQEVSAVVVSPLADTLVTGDTLRLAAEARDANGHPVAEVEFAWASSDTLVAVVDSAGLVTGIDVGEAEVSATAAGVTGRAQLTVVDPVPTTVSVTPDTVALTALEQTAELTAEVRDQAGRTMVDVPVSWASSDTTIVAVDSVGLVTAVSIGTATITATADEASGEAVVTVMQSAGAVVVSPPADTVALGDTLRLVATVYDENGHRVEGAELVWSSSDASIARVDGSGLITAVAEGTATITATVGDALGTAEITVTSPDRAALEALYNATDGPNWVNSENWLTDAPLGDWHGVDTDASGRVVRLDLSGLWDSEFRGYTPHGLRGAIPPEVGELANLRFLSLYNNNLTGPIPPELGDLATLRRLSLYNNDLTGPVPSTLANLASLEGLDVYGNSLSGPIPPELGSLASLTRLQLGSNTLSGPIPPELGKLVRLTYLSLSRNDLSGPIPPELGVLTNLTRLYLGSNNLTGPIPPGFVRLKEMRLLNVAENELCVPGTSAFAAWLRAVERHDAPPTGLCNTADVAALDALYAMAGGTGWTESGGWPDGRFVEDRHGVDVDSVGRVTELDLARNGLEGELPPDLGAMTRLTVLRIGDNALSGRLPLSLARAPLREFRYAETELCAPVDESFQTWLNAIASHDGTGVECVPLTEREILEILYNVTGGPNWHNNENWLTDAQLRDWAGVSVDGQGRVVRLFAHGNLVAGPIPPELGKLANLTQVNLGDNQLTGPIPAELGNLVKLTQLDLGDNQLTGPIPAELGNLLKLTQLDLGYNQLTGPIPAELGNLTNLTSLSLSWNDLTDAIPPELGKLANLEGLYLYSNDLSGPIPPELGSLNQLRHFGLGWNYSISGPIPPELGNLANLRDLRLFRTALSGAIPPEFGNLVELRELHLSSTALTGAIPPEFGNLVNLRFLSLRGNGHTGPIPPELGNLTSLEELRLYNTKLSGPIPSELGNLTSLEEMHLYNANLTGPLPPELGSLANVRFLSLASNALSGPVPPEFGALRNVEVLALANNARLTGALPHSLTELDRLQELVTSGTDLCSPADAGFRSWLDGVHKRRIKFCVEGDPPIAYLTQAVQSRAFPVPLVAGEEALLRVFPTASQVTSVGIPAVRARFYVNGREIHVVDIPGKSAPIPIAVDESRLSKSANAEIPAEVIRPGLEMVVEVDPEGTLDEALGVTKRIPETGRLAVDVRAMPRFDLTLIPFVWIQTQDSAIVDLVEAMAADPENHEMLGDTRTLMPVGSLDVTAHEPVLTTSNNGFQIFGETIAIRAMEGGTGHYMGMMANPVTGVAGIARLSGRWSFSIPEPSTIAHELGHNMSLRHAPCGGPGGLDPSYPYTDGSIGVWGYDFRDGGSLVQPSRPDVMSYCFPGQWTSDYGFTNALRYRLFDEGAPASAAASARATSFLLWGGVDADGEPSLNPVFVVDAPAALPDSAGEHEITGRAADGRELFSLAFTMPETADGDGSSSFTFVLPVRDGWKDDLERIILTGPGGSFTLDDNNDHPMAILLDPRTRQVRGILRDLPPPTQAALNTTGPAAGTELKVLFSRGIPGPEAWRR